MDKITKIARSLICGAAILAGIAATAQSNVHITPAPGEVADLSEFIISFDDEWGLGTARSAKFTLTGPEGVDIPQLRSRSLGPEIGYRVYLADDAVITTPGNYTFTIPAGKFEIDDEELPEMSFEYVITEEGAASHYTGSVTVDPAEGTYSSISMITLTFDGAVEIVDQDAFIFEGKIEDFALSAEARDNTLILVPKNADQTISEPGAYQLTIARAALAIDGKTTGAMAFDYNIDNATAAFPGCVITPAPGQYSAIADGFSLEFVTDESVSVSKSLIWLTGPSGDIGLEVTSAEGSNRIDIMPVDAAGNAITIDEKGSYSLIITMGAVKIGNTANDEPLVFVYDVLGASGIDSVEADDLEAEIYTTSGMRVHQPVRGINIINGKKTIK